MIPVSGKSSALFTATQGVQKSQNDVAKAAFETVKAYSDAANAVSDRTTEVAAVGQLSDVITPMVDMKIGVAAYTANLATLKVAGEMQETLVDTMT